MEIDGGFDLLTPEAPNYLLIAHATVCIRELSCDFSSSVDASLGVKRIWQNVYVFCRIKQEESTFYSK